MRKLLPLSIFLLAILTHQASAAIIEAKGWLETLYVTWDKSVCTKFDVEYRTSNTGNWIKIDDQLVRAYGPHYRADILGLKAGSYDVRVIPSGGTAMIQNNITVTAHERTGFAFMDGVVPGAYKADGTLKDNAQVIYVTKETAKTVSLAVRTGKNGATTASAGVFNIMKSVEKGYEDRPLVFRIIGTITEADFTALDGGDIPIKGNCNNLDGNCYITFEGVGNDATIYGTGFKITTAENFEIRNLGIMLTKSTEGDNVGINSASKHGWIHNNDFFYGMPGSDADQVKGDGTTDIKKSTNMTVSYNHYWENGKVHLLGNGETPGGYITLHHNWYDHSDSRHPRVRHHLVHVYNNYYDGIPTYGIGASINSSIFSERNYFRNANRPMTISMQGSDNGTFSSENGGMIKAFDNYMDAASKSKYTPWSSSNTVDFDAYEVSSPTETVPATVKAKKGGHTFYNDILKGYPAYTSDPTSAVVEKVKTYAGRYWGGDFKYTFNNSSDDGSSSIISALKNALTAYKTGLVSVQTSTGFTGTGCTVVTPSSSSLVPSSSSSAPTTTPSSSSLTPSSSSSFEDIAPIDPPVVSSDFCAENEKCWNFSEAPFTSALPVGSSSITDNYAISGLSIIYDGSAEMGYTMSGKSIDGYEFDYRFQLKGGGSITKRALKFDVSGNREITVYGIANSVRTLVLNNGTAEVDAKDLPAGEMSKITYTYAGDATSLYLFSKSSGIDIYGIKVCCEEASKTLPNIASGNTLFAASNMLNLQVTARASIEIFDLKGNLVRSLKRDIGNHSISLGDLPQGLYFVKAKSASWQKTVKAFVAKF